MDSPIINIVNHARFLARHLDGCDLRCVVIAILFDLRFPTKGNGFEYTKNAVLVRCGDPALPTVKGVYPAVGRMYDPEVGWQLVEQNIRYAIAAAWGDRDEKIWSRYFSSTEKRPSNEKFITTIALFLELMRGCGKEVCFERE